MNPVFLTPQTKKIIKKILWGTFFVFMIFFFSILKLPDDQIKKYINSIILNACSQQGISFEIKETQISFLFGMSYTLKDITLHFPPPSQSISIDEIKITPSIFSLILGKTSGKIEVKKGSGYFKGSGSFYKNQGSFDFKFNKFKFEKPEILSTLLGVPFTGEINGQAKASGDLSTPDSWKGEIQLELSQITWGPQAISGFSLPRISVSEGKVDILLSQSKVKFQTLSLGSSLKSQKSTDDIQGNLSGDILLKKPLPSSLLNLQAQFSFSESLLKSLVLLEMILGSGKQEDGTFAYQITGTFEAPLPLPKSTKPKGP